MIRLLARRIKALNLPWQANRFMGYDLDGNMYFEGPPTREGVTLPRRSVEYRGGAIHPSQYDPSTIPVQWLAWMRHTRADPPTIDELHADAARRAFVEQRALELESKDAAERAAQMERQAALIASANAQSAAQPLAEPVQATPPPAPPPEPSKPAGQGFTPESWQPTGKPRPR
ncbi:hypothetical protein HK105_201496 [Polyrhizophydium stewartii]|uniref:NADH dehydrogenase [ubiquinone] 1 alpha subcomplex subunit 12 n=1 Tax=Polyrhizophydium stewartii TaxID=2732419 RepID=A0ABR4NGL6_9FUNG|nr:hypothetical protein HK105_007800 [Polyrhizophydium stewartii]